MTDNFDVQWMKAFLETAGEVRTEALLRTVQAKLDRIREFLHNHTRYLACLYNPNSGEQLVRTDPALRTEQLNYYEASQITDRLKCDLKYEYLGLKDSWL